MSLVILINRSIVHFSLTVLKTDSMCELFFFAASAVPLVVSFVVTPFFVFYVIALMVFLSSIQFSDNNAI